jgi:hypothetical protein
MSPAAGERVGLRADEMEKRSGWVPRPFSLSKKGLHNFLCILEKTRASVRAIPSLPTMRLLVPPNIFFLYIRFYIFFTNGV